MLETLYLDDSGQFSRSTAGVTGLRLVGGLLLPGSEEEHTRVLQPAIDNALEWFPAPVHAVEVASVGRVASALRSSKSHVLSPELQWLRAKLRRLPFPSMWDLRAVDPEAFEAARRESKRLLAAIRNVVAQALSSKAGTIVLCAEHDLTPSEPRFDPMLIAACEGALELCAHHRKDDTTLDVVFESGGAGHDSSNTARTLSVGDRTNARLAPGAPRQAPKSAGIGGLGLADIVVHALGPGGRQNVAWQPRLCSNWSIEHVRRAARVAFGVRDVPVVVVDALRGADLRRSVRAGTVPREDALEQLRLHHNKLPRGVLLASMQWAARHLSQQDPSR